MRQYVADVLAGAWRIVRFPARPMPAIPPLRRSVRTLSLNEVPHPSPSGPNETGPGGRSVAAPKTKTTKDQRDDGEATPSASNKNR